MVTALLLTLAWGSGQVPPAVREELAGWKPVKEDRLSPPANRWVRDACVEGQWRTGRSYSMIEVTRMTASKGRYQVEVTMGTCVSEMTTRSEGTYRDGAIFLDKPIYEFEPADRIYPVWIKGQIRLVTPRGWDRAEKEIRNELWGVVGELTYGKNPPVKIDQPGAIPPG